MNSSNEAFGLWTTQKPPWLFASWRRFATISAVILVIPTLLLLLFVSLNVRRKLLSQVAEESSLLLNLVSRHLTTEIAGLKNYLASFAFRPSLTSALVNRDFATVETQLARMVETNPKLVGALITDTNGIVIRNYPFQPHSPGEDVSSAHWFQQIRVQTNGLVAVTDEHEPVLTLASGLRRADGSPAGYLVAQCSTAQFVQWVDAVTPRELGFVAVSDAEGRALLDANHFFELLRAKPSASPLHPPDVGKPAHGSPNLVTFPTGESYYATAGIVPEVLWKVFVFMPRGTALAPVRDLQRSIGVFFGVFALAFVFFGFYWLRTVYVYARGIERSQKEIERLCYSISHNFKAPARAVSGFSDVFLEEYGQEVPAEAKDYVERMRSAALKMHDLIEDFLIYGRLTHMPLHLESLDLRQIVTEGVAQVKEGINRQAAKLHIEVDEVQVLADRHILTLAVSELVANAVRFCRAGTEHRVDIRSDVEARFVRLWFIDNGIGIEAAHRGRIFDLFAKLDESTPGTGVGLAIAKSGIERLNGRIGVEPGPLTGTAFWIEIARA